jgi:penicillin-binding protein 1C
MMSRKVKGTILAVLILLGLVSSGVAVRTARDIRPVPDSLAGLLGEIRKPRLTDRNGRPLTVTYANRWNTSACLALHEVPEVMRKAFVFSEDRRFYRHGGVDWAARSHALVQNVMALSTVRGASTITEQVVRMIHPRPRTVWSRWIEGFEAMALENRHSKAAILEFYLNQVPFASNRRGVVQAAAHYFNRSPDTLTVTECLALAVLVRAPSYYDLYRNPGAIKGPLNGLAERLHREALLSDSQLASVREGVFDLERPGLSIDADHAARFIMADPALAKDSLPDMIRTTLDGALQVRVQDLVRTALETLGDKHVANAACLVVDHGTAEILAWVSEGLGDEQRSGRFINGVTTLRQPGSSMKPFLYALALDRGWTPAFEILDTPLTNAVGRGLHTYHNYSRSFYGWVSLRQALGNSLNIPAVKTIRFVGYESYLRLLHLMGFESLDRHPDFYGDGLALGCGEVSLYQMVQAYAALANRGVFRPLTLYADGGSPLFSRRIFSEEAASLIGDILSDAQARNLEFGAASPLNFPVQTAVKTGTSSDYRDAWALGYNHRFTAGVWMGNFDGRAMDGVTGSTGSALVLRAVFAELNRGIETRPLFLSPRLTLRDVSIRQGHGDETVARREWFAPGSEPPEQRSVLPQVRVGFIKPVNGLEMAMDPRIPDDDEAFEFVVGGVGETDRTVWHIDGQGLGETRGGRYLWTLQKGRHVVETTVYKQGSDEPLYNKVMFVVK